MDPIHGEVARFLRAADVSRGSPVLVAVSGGGDSVALLYVLSQLGQRVGAAHVHHGLRGAEADADFVWVERLAGELGVPFHGVRVSTDVTALHPQDVDRGPEGQARAVRYRALEELRVAGGYAWLATAHNRDDQAETVLLRAIRGTDLSGLRGVVPRSDTRRLLRPMLGLGREELRAYLRRRLLSWREDGSNSDLGVPRNRIRERVLGELERAHPGASAQLARLAETAREWREARRPELDALLDSSCLEADGGFWICTPALAGIAAPARRELVAELMRRLGAAHRITRAHLERVDLFLANASSGRALSLPSGLTVVCDYDRHWLGPAPGPDGPGELVPHDLRPGCVLSFPERGLRLRWSSAAEAWEAPVRMGLEEPAPAVLQVRSPCKDDRLEAREGDSRRLSRLFTAARWPRRVRQRAIVVEAGQRILCVLGVEPQPADAAGRDWRILVADRGHARFPEAESGGRSGPREELLAQRLSAPSSTW